MFIIVGNNDDKADPRRWVWDGAIGMRLLLSESQYQELVNRAAVGLFKLSGDLSNPYWMSTAERALYGQA